MAGDRGTVEMIAVVAHGPSPLWYATRGAGAVALLLLTISVALGIAEVRRWQPLGAPRFGVAAVHRSASLLAVAVLLVHIGTTLVDPSPSVGVANAVVPFATTYRPLWLGLGTIAADLLLAVVITSLVRRRLGLRSWRAVHWLSYACWPVAVLHGIGAGSDTSTTWMLALTTSCVAVVGAVVVARVASATATPGSVRATTIAAVVVLLAGGAAWTAQGPLASGWARRSGTPAAVLAAFHPAPAPSGRPQADRLYRRFRSALAGTLHTGAAQDGSAVVDLPLRLSSGQTLRIRIGGTQLADGAVRMERSAVTLGPAGDPGAWQGRITTLRGGDLRATVGDAHGRALRLRVHLTLGAARAQGHVDVIPARGALA